MEAKSSLKRREFLKITGGALMAATHVPSVIAGNTEDDQRPVKRDPARMKRLLDQMDAKGYRFWSVPRKDGEFLHLFVKAIRAKNVLELGTSQGVSAIWMALGLEETGGRLTTIEIDKERYTTARKNLDEAGVLNRVTPILGDGHAELARLEGPFDFVFLDADKEGQVDYFNKLYPKKLVPGGVIAVHNAIQQAGSMKDYLDMIRRHSAFDSVILSVTMDDGFCLSYRHRV